MKKKMTLEEQQECLFRTKLWALRIPWIMAIIALLAIVVITVQVFLANISLKVTYSLGITVGLSIIAIAFTVWVGLNIYTAIKESQIDLLERKVKEMTMSTEELIYKMKDLESKLKTQEEKFNAIEDQIRLNNEFSNAKAESRDKYNKHMMIGDPPGTVLVTQKDFELLLEVFEAENRAFLINEKLKTPNKLDFGMIFMYQIEKMIQFLATGFYDKDVDLAYVQKNIINCLEIFGQRAKFFKENTGGVFRKESTHSRLNEIKDIVEGKKTLFETGPRGFNPNEFTHIANKIEETMKLFE